MRTNLVILAAVHLLLSLPMAAAQPRGMKRGGPGPGSPVAGRGMPTLFFTFTTTQSMALDADFDDRPGGYSLYRGRASLSLTSTLGEQGFLTLSLHRGLTRAEFQEETNLVPGGDKPFDSLSTSVLGLGYRHIFDRQWAGMVSLRTRVNQEEGADLEKSLSWFGLVGARWQCTQDLALSFGLIGVTHLEEDPLFIPGLLIDWDITDRLRLSTTDDLRLTYDLGGGWKTFLHAGYEGDYFRLDDHGTQPGGVVRMQRFPLRLGVGYSLGPRFLRVEGSLGYSFGQKLSLYDPGGHRVLAEDLEGSLLLGLSLRVNF